MAKMLRKTITISQEDYDLIMSHVKDTSKSFSQFLRERAVTYVKDVEKMSLMEYLKCQPYADAEEQAWFDSIRDTLDLHGEDKGEELTLEDILGTESTKKEVSR